MIKLVTQIHNFFSRTVTGLVGFQFKSLWMRCIISYSFNLRICKYIRILISINKLGLLAMFPSFHNNKKQYQFP